MRVLRFITLGVPISLWMIHVFLILPILKTQSGDAKFLTAFQFFFVSATLMLCCLIISLVMFARNKTPINLIPVLLNLTWLYYVKVILFGPTVGNF
jgi:hypothetical protein